MKRVFLGLLLFVMLFIVSACKGKDTDRETEQLTEDISTGFEPDTAMPIEDDAEETENQKTEMIDVGIFDFETKKVMLNSGYIDMMLLHHPGSGDVKAYKVMEKYVEKGKIRSLGLSNWYVEELTNDKALIMV